LARRYSTSRLLLAGAVIQGLGLGILAAAGAGYPVMIIAVLAVSLGQMLYSPAVSTFVSRNAAPGRRATYQAAISTTEDIGTALGPVTGLALGAVGPPSLVWLLALPATLTAGIASAHATAQPRPSPGSGDSGAVIAHEITQ
jgi:predicted MFS family arabinose efflux permease